MKKLMKINRSLFLNILLLPIALFSFPAFSAEYQVSSYFALFDHLEGCNTMTDVLTYTKDAVTISLTADPAGYCMITVKNNAEGIHQAQMVCHFTAEDVAKMTSPEAKQALAGLQGNSQGTKPEDINRYFAPMMACVAEINKAHPLPAPTTPPGVTTGPTPIPPPGAVPPGAVPSGSIITLPPGTKPAPGSPTSIQAP